MKTVVTALPYFQKQGEYIASALDGEFKPYRAGLFPELFQAADRIVAIMAVGIVIRGIAPLIHDKWTDPAVVVVSPDMQYAIRFLEGIMEEMILPTFWRRHVPSPPSSPPQQKQPAMKRLRSLQNGKDYGL
jgi:hypothetical protein